MQIPDQMHPPGREDRVFVSRAGAEQLRVGKRARALTPCSVLLVGVARVNEVLSTWVDQ